MYCAWRIGAHLRCTQCSILLHFMDICFLTCICLYQILQTQTCLFDVVGPGFVSTSPAFVRSSSSHPAGSHGRLARKTVNRALISGGGKARQNMHSSLSSSSLFLILFMLTCSMMRFLSLLLLGLCPCVVSVVVFGLSVRLSWYPMWTRWLL